MLRTQRKLDDLEVTQRKQNGHNTTPLANIKNKGCFSAVIHLSISHIWVAVVEEEAVEAPVAL